MRSAVLISSIDFPGDGMNSRALLTERIMICENTAHMQEKNWNIPNQMEKSIFPM